jgi:hypothetical protein
VNNAEQDRILGRIRKMVALANDAAASEGERDNAMRMVHSTLAKYNLTMAMAEEAGTEKSEAREKGVTTSRDQPWCRHVAHAIAELFFCRYFYSKTAKRGTVSHNFVGRSANVITASAMTDFVIRSVMSEANKGWKKAADPGPWWTSFCKGATDHIASRCRALREEAEKESVTEKTPGTSLVLASFYKQEMDANAKFLEALGIHLRIKKTREIGAGDGYSAGRDFGGKINLSRQLGGASNTTRRLS